MASGKGWEAERGKSPERSQGRALTDIEKMCATLVHYIFYIILSYYMVYGNFLIKAWHVIPYNHN